MLICFKLLLQGKVPYLKVLQSIPNAQMKHYQPHPYGLQKHGTLGATGVLYSIFHAISGNLIKSLEESEQLLGELSVMCRQKQAKVTGFSEALHTMDKDVMAEIEELTK